MKNIKYLIYHDKSSWYLGRNQTYAGDKINGPTTPHGGYFNDVISARAGLTAIIKRVMRHGSSYLTTDREDYVIREVNVETEFEGISHPSKG